MNYRLLVEIDKQWRELDLGDEKPSMNYVQNDIGEIKDRRSNYSHKLQLPLTDGNVIALGMIDRIESAANVADRLLPCRLYCDEYEIVGSDGLMTIISVSNDCITVQVISGATDLLNQLKSGKMENIDLGVFGTGAKDFVPDNFGDFKIVCLSKFWYDEELEQHVGNTLPFARFVKVVEKILERYEYRLECNIAGDVQDVVLPVVVPPANPYERKDILLTASNRFERPRGDSINLRQWKVDKDDTKTLTAVWNSRELEWRPQANSADVPGEAMIQFTIAKNLLEATQTSGDSFPPRIRLTASKNGQQIHSGEYWQGSSPDINVMFAAGDVFAFKIEIVDLMGNPCEDRLIWDNPNSRVQYNIGITIKNDSLRQARSPYRWVPVKVSASLGFDTQLDVVKAFVNTFCLWVDIDRKQKIFRANTFRKVIEEKRRQVDWTTKVDMREFECEFHNMDYAQRNRINMEENTRQGIREGITMELRDELLVSWKEILKLPFEAGRGDCIPLQKVEKYSIYEPEATRPHLCRLAESEPKDIGVGTHTYRKVTHYDMSELKQYYEPFFKILDGYRNVTVKMLLEPPDLEVMQERIPVYLQQFGHYFYINSVRNYVCGQLAEVEMIRV